MDRSAQIIRTSVIGISVDDTLTAHRELVQIHGFYFSEKENLLTVDVVPDLSVRDEDALRDSLTRELTALIPGPAILVTVDHNYTE